MRYFVLTAFFFLAAACGPASKVVDAAKSYDAHVADSLKVQTEQLRRFDASISSKLDALRESITTLQMQSERTQYSPPDSAGRQYVIVRERTIADSKSEAKDVQSMRNDGFYKRMDSLMNDISRRIDSLAVTRQAVYVTEEQGPSWYQSALMYGGAAALVLLIFFIIKKMKIL